ncbi:MAG TPA: ABATE domain-containing protein, partial [Streptomyces sp.]
MAAGTAPSGWRFDAGRVCLDLLATGPGGGREQLDSAARLADWLLAAGLLPAGTGLAGVDESWVTRFRQLRSALDRLLTAELRGRRADDALGRVNEAAAAAPPVPRAVR